MSRYRCPYCRSRVEPRHRLRRTPLGQLVVGLFFLAGLAGLLTVGGWAALSGDMAIVLVAFLGLSVPFVAGLWLIDRLLTEHRRQCPDCRSLLPG